MIARDLLTKLRARKKILLSQAHLTSKQIYKGADDDAPPSLYARVMSWNLPEQRRTYGLLRGAESSLDARVVVSHDPELLSALPTTREVAWPCAWDKRKSSPKPKR